MNDPPTSTNYNQFSMNSSISYSLTNSYSQHIKQSNNTLKYNHSLTNLQINQSLIHQSFIYDFISQSINKILIWLINHSFNHNLDYNTVLTDASLTNSSINQFNHPLHQ